MLSDASLARPWLGQTLLVRSIAFAVLAAVAAGLAYWPGLAGPFLFDDVDSLGGLGRYGGVRDWASFREFVLGGNAGPTGRPLALLSFLIDGRDWPTDPWPFKRTNLVIHIVNGLLVAVVCRQVLGVLGSRGSRGHWVALFAAFCWLLHPFFVSTVLYPVQRMAQLAALFVFAGIALYAWGRTRVGRRPTAAYLAMSAGAGACSVLAVLCKENGALLPVLLIVFELTIVRNAKTAVPPVSRLWAATFLVLPCLLILAYFLRIALLVDLLAQKPMRGFSLYERFMTEGRIVADYLRNLLLPSLYTPGIFRDGVAKSTGWFEPLSTALAALLHVSLVVLAILWRRRLPVAAFAILFFYAAHLVESTYLNLELYFEHRNYLPAAFLFLPIAALAADRLPPRAAIAAGVIAIAVLGGFTRYSANLWSSYESLVAAAARAAPRSARAQQQLSMLVFNAGDAGTALRITENALALQPASQDLNIWKLAILCKTGALGSRDVDTAIDAMGTPPYDLRTLRFHETIVASVTAGECPGTGAADLERLYSNLLAHPINGDPGSAMFAQLTYLEGVVALRDGRPSEAAERFRRSLTSRLGVGRAMQMAALFADRAYYDEALDFSATALGYFDDDGGARGEASGITRADVLDFRRRVQAELDR